MFSIGSRRGDHAVSLRCAIDLARDANPPLRDSMAPPRSGCDAGPATHPTEGTCHVGENFCLEGLVGLWAGLAALPSSLRAQESAKPPAQTAQPAAKAKSSATVSGATETSTPRREPTEAQLAARERRVKCGAEWRAAKEKGSVEEGATWPKYWSACNKRLKEQGA